MAPKRLTDYERQRLENIRRNKEIMAALKIHSKVDELTSASSKRQRTESKSYKLSTAKKAKNETPVVIRRSLRMRGIEPENVKGLEDDLVVASINETLISPKKYSPLQPHPISMKDAYIGTGSDQALIETIVRASEKFQNEFINKCSDDKQVSNSVHEIHGTNRVVGSVNLGAFSLEPENIARVMPGRILNVKFFPSTDVNMIVAGNKFGDIALWNFNSEKDDQNEIYLYHPHSAPVSGISIQPFALSKVFTSCYDGFIRVLDAEKEVFDLLYYSDEAIYSLSHHPNDFNRLYFSEGHQGGLNMWDLRSGKCSSSWTVHEDRINSIDFNSHDPKTMATSSTDGTVCVWDLRKIDARKPKYLKTVHHERAVHSAYFSPSGNCIATTSIDNKVGILSGVDYEDVSMIQHNNQTGRWISSFRGIWGWDDSHVFIGNMKRAVDVISPSRRETVTCLESELMSAIPCRFDAHPFKIGMLAAATSGGQIYLWTSSSSS